MLHFVLLSPFDEAAGFKRLGLMCGCFYLPVVAAHFISCASCVALDVSFRAQQSVHVLCMQKFVVGEISAAFKGMLLELTNPCL